MQETPSFGHAGRTMLSQVLGLVRDPDRSILDVRVHGVRATRIRYSSGSWVRGHCRDSRELIANEVHADIEIVDSHGETILRLGLVGNRLPRIECWWPDKTLLRGRSAADLPTLRGHALRFHPGSVPCTIRIHLTAGREGPVESNGEILTPDRSCGRAEKKELLRLEIVAAKFPRRRVVEAAPEERGSRRGSCACRGDEGRGRRVRTGDVPEGYDASRQ